MKISTIASRTILGAVLCFGSVGLIACEEEGPAEQAGEKADEAVQDTKRKIQDAAD